MKLNRNSIPARLYRWFYMTPEMPQNLCPYFWKLVFMWFLIIPYGALSLPVVIIKEKPDEWAMRPIVGTFMYGFLFLAALMIFPVTYLFWGQLDPKSMFGSWQVFGLGLWAVAIICAITWATFDLIHRAKEKKRRAQLEFIWNEEGEFVPNPDYLPYEPKPSIIIEFIKAKYNRYCPKIDWN